MESTSFICLLILFVAFGQTIIGLLSASRKKKEREKKLVFKISKNKDILQGNKEARKISFSHIFFFIIEHFVEMLFAKAFTKLANFHSKVK